MEIELFGTRVMIKKLTEPLSGGIETAPGGNTTNVFDRGEVVAVAEGVTKPKIGDKIFFTGGYTTLDMNGEKYFVLFAEHIMGKVKDE